MWSSQPQGASRVNLGMGQILLILACVVMAIGAYSRFDSITEIGMWNDEFHSLRLSDPSQSISDLIDARIANEGPPLYQLFLYWVRALGADSEVGMRLVQHLLFVLGIVLLWTGLNPVSGALVRSIQSAFLLGSYGLVYYSGELRSYSLVIFLGLLQVLLFLKIVFALEKSGRPPHLWMTVFAAVSVALSLVHYVAAIAVATSCTLLAAVALSTGRIRTLVSVVAYGLAACLPVIGWFLASYDSSAAALVHLPDDLVFLIRQIDRFLRLLGGSNVAALCLAGLIAAGVWTTVRALIRQGSEASIELRAALWLGTFAGVTWLLAYAFSIAVVPVVSMRNLLVTAPAIYLALACVISDWLKSSDQKIARAGLAMTITYLLSSAASPWLGRDLLGLHAKKDWVASAERINALEACVAQPIVVVANHVGFYRHYIDGGKRIDLVPMGASAWVARPGDGHMHESVELSDGEVARARELSRWSHCEIKVWYVPTGFVSDEQALDLGAQILGAGNFRLERVGNAMLFRG
jgi:hypothetical protein